VLVLRYNTERAFQAEERRFLSTLADDCSQALERARLHAETESQAERATLLLEIAKSLDAVSSYSGRAAALVAALVPELADFASIEGIDSDGAPATLATHQAGGPRGEDGATLHREAIAMAARAVWSGAAECIDVSSGGIAGTCVVVPLTPGAPSTAALLAITVAGQADGARPELSLFSEIGHRAALALENARLYEREHHIALTLQQGLLPPALPDPDGLEFAVAFVPMGEGNEVGGDFYDVFKKGDAYTAVIGDVCGKGAEAARLTALCRHTLRTAAMLDGAGPARTLALLNRAILDQTPAAEFCTVAATDLVPTERGTVRATISSAGHPAPIIVRREGGVELPEIPGTVLGVVDDPRLEESSIELDVGDTLVFVTDGVEEARDEDGSFFGRERLEESIRRAAGSGRSVTAAALVAAIRTDVETFCGSRTLRDDVIILAIRCTPARAPSALSRDDSTSQARPAVAGRDGSVERNRVSETLDALER
jgi:serine phosphatase RsbU (regulator of sigma subunit)